MRVYRPINQPRLAGKARGGLNSDSKGKRPLRVRVRERSVTKTAVKPNVASVVSDVQQCSTPGCPECIWPTVSPSASGWWQKSPSSRMAPTSVMRAVICRRWCLIAIQCQEFSMKVLPNDHEVAIPSHPCTTPLSTITCFSLLSKIFSCPRYCLATRAQQQGLSKKVGVRCRFVNQDEALEPRRPRSSPRW